MRCAAPRDVSEHPTARIAGTPRKSSRQIAACSDFSDEKVVHDRRPCPIGQGQDPETRVPVACSAPGSRSSSESLIGLSQFLAVQCVQFMAQRSVSFPPM